MMSHFAYRQKEAYLAITYMNNTINSQYPLLFGGRKYSQVYRGDDTRKEANNRAKGTR